MDFAAGFLPSFPETVLLKTLACGLSDRDSESLGPGDEVSTTSWEQYTIACAEVRVFLPAVLLIVSINHGAEWWTWKGGQREILFQGVAWIKAELPKNLQEHVGNQVIQRWVLIGLLLTSSWVSKWWYKFPPTTHEKFVWFEFRPFANADSSKRLHWNVQEEGLEESAFCIPSPLCSTLEKWGFVLRVPLKGVSVMAVEGLQSITSPTTLHLVWELKAATFKGAYHGGPW